MPGPDYLAAAAKALGIDQTELVPRRPEEPSDPGFPTLALNAEPDGRAWLRINRAVSMDTAIKIFSMINDEDKATRTI